MKINRIDNHLSAENQPAIKLNNGCEWWYLGGRLHRSGKPAVVNRRGTTLYFWRGINISERIARGEMTVEEILAIDNMEKRQAAMEILGYEKFFSHAKLLHKFTPKCFINRYPVESNPMYCLYLIDTNKDEMNDPVKILMMCDPSKEPVVRYFIRVHPDETHCGEAVAHSYKYKNYAEFIRNKQWV